MDEWKRQKLLMASSRPASGWLYPRRVQGLKPLRCTVTARVTNVLTVRILASTTSVAISLLAFIIRSLCVTKFVSVTSYGITWHRKGCSYSKRDVHWISVSLKTLRTMSGTRRLRQFPNLRYRSLPCSGQKSLSKRRPHPEKYRPGHSSSSQYSRLPLLCP